MLIPNYSSPKSLIIWGDSRLGKTLWARSLGEHAYFGGLYSMDEPIHEARYGVFDDIMGGLDFFPGYKQWLGGQKCFYVTDKYKGKKYIEWGRPAIWVANADPRGAKTADIEWLEANCTIVRITTPIFRANTE